MIYCLGEALIDKYDEEACVGGAPANVSACIARLNDGDPMFSVTTTSRGCKRSSAFVGGIADDEYGRLIYDTLFKCGVDMRYAKIVAGGRTAVAHVEVIDGERYFRFDRDGTADLGLSVEDVAKIPFKKGDVLHFCSNCLMDGNMANVHRAAIAAAKAAGAIISYDPNLRPALWQDKDEMLKTAYEFLRYADLIKASYEEAVALGALYDGKEDLALRCSCAPEELRGFVAACEHASILITKGADDTDFYYMAPGDTADERGEFVPCLTRRQIPTVKGAVVADTTGAGDCFIGATLHDIAGSGGISPLSVSCAAHGAQQACALSIGRRGAIPSYPDFAELYEYKKALSPLKRPMMDPYALAARAKAAREAINNTIAGMTPQEVRQWLYGASPSNKDDDKQD